MRQQIHVIFVIMKLKITLSALLFLAATIPAFADAKSMTVNVSCTVPAMIEMAASPNAQLVQARSNMNDQYQMTEDLGSRDGRRVKVYSLTAL